jgi:hypothetical protein
MREIINTFLNVVGGFGGTQFVVWGLYFGNYFSVAFGAIWILATAFTIPARVRWAVNAR